MPGWSRLAPVEFLDKFKLAPVGRAALLAFMWVSLGWIADAALTTWAVLVLAIWRCYWPGSFTCWVAAPVRGKWRAWWCYRRRWEAVMNVADLAPWYRGRILMPVLGRVTATRYTERVAVRLVSGQCADDFAKRADNLAHGFGAMLCRVRSARAGSLVLDSSAATPWPLSSPACSSRTGWTFGRCRWAVARTASRGRSGCTAPTS